MLQDIPALVLLLAILALTLLSAYFSSSETAMMALNRYRLRHLAKEGHPGAGKTLKLVRHPDQLLGVILLGNNLVNFLAAGIGSVVGMRLMGDAGAVLTPILLTLFFLVFAELAPKTVAASRPEALAFASSHVLTALLRMLRKVVQALNLTSNALAKPFLGGHSTSDRLSADELKTLIAENAGVSSRHRDILIGAVELDTATVDDIMVPRQDIIGLDLEAPQEVNARLLADSEHTRMPLYEGGLNHIVGMLHMRSLASYDTKGGLTRETLRQLAKPPYFIPESTPLIQQLTNFQRTRRRTAIVVDEYGDVRGLVALEDILEEIVGEFTTDPAEAKQADPTTDERGRHLLDGAASVRDINRVLNWQLPTQGARTLSGLIMETLEHIPKSNISLQIGRYRFETLTISRNRIRKLKAWEASDQRQLPL